jgi:hypothetical protein
LDRSARIVATAIVFGTLIPGLAFNGLLYAITFPILAGVFLREIWAKGWYIPEADPPKRERSIAEPSPAPAFEPEPITSGNSFDGDSSCSDQWAFAYGNAGIQAGVVSLAMIWLLVCLWTTFDR